jgi:Fic family protein
LSAFFEATRDEYYKQLYNVSGQGSWNDWLLYFLHGVIAQSSDVLSRAERINALLQEWQVRIGPSEKVACQIIRYLAVNPYFTIKKISGIVGVAFSTAQRAISKLERSGIVAKISAKKRDRVYCATDILKILEEPTVVVERVSE